MADSAKGQRSAGARALLGGASIETAVRNLAEIEAFGPLLPSGIQAFIPWLPASPYSHTVTVARALSRAGFVPVPHIAARRLPDEASARDFVSRLCGEAGVTSVLLIGGDVERPAGPFDSARSLLETGVLESSGVRSVGFAGYPEGHPAIPEATLQTELDAKLKRARSGGLDAFVVSQFCFDADAILGWLARLRGHGVGVPVRIGLAGPASVRTLIGFGMRCGVGPSLRFIKGRGLSLTRMVSEEGPETILDTFVAMQERGAFDANAQVHLFAFGGVAKTARWLAG
jgi:methylenetetrahydrofolate reductase (NADPH)